MQSLLRALQVSSDNPKQGPTNEWLNWATLKVEAAQSENQQSEGYLNRSFSGVTKRGDKGGDEDGRSGGRVNTP